MALKGYLLGLGLQGIWPTIGASLAAAQVITIEYCLVIDWSCAHVTPLTTRTWSWIENAIVLLCHT